VYAHLAPPMRCTERENPTTAEHRMRTRPGTPPTERDRNRDPMMKTDETAV